MEIILIVIGAFVGNILGNAYYDFFKANKRKNSENDAKEKEVSG